MSRRDARQLVDQWRARARDFDTSPGGVNALRRLRRALPGDPAFGDPLSIAGRDGAGAVARLADRLFDDEPRASREVSLAALQVWHAALERSGRAHGSDELTILFTDLVEFSSWAVEAGDEPALALLRAVAAAVEPPVLAHRGRIVKRLGDGLMAVFPSPQLGLDAVFAARAGLREIEVEGYRPQLRAGLHRGTPRRIGDDYLGVDVNVAARLVERAGANEILISETALAAIDPDRVQTRRKKTFWPNRVKGVPGELGVYAVNPRG